MSRPTPRAPRQAAAMDATAPALRPVVLPWPIFGWEYHEAMLPHAKPWDTTLNRLGLEGWDLVAVLHDESSDKGSYAARALFKRPRPEPPNEEELRDLGFRNPDVWTPWLEEARESYLALIQGVRAQAEGRVSRRTEED